LQRKLDELESNVNRWIMESSPLLKSQHLIQTLQKLFSWV